MTELTGLAATFARAIVSGDPEDAREMLSDGLRRMTAATDLSKQFELLADDMGGVTGIGEPMVILEEWPDMSANDRAVV
jgi:hypothetical protein